MKTEKSELFETVPVGRAVITLALPTVIGQVITVIYNMADTYFIGQLGDPAQVAAVQVAMPLFIFFNAISNLFGIGGASLISRSLGDGDTARARRASAFCIWTAAFAAVVYGLTVGALRPRMLPVLGATKDSLPFSSDYVFWTITVGALPTVMNNILAHMIRAEGHASVASAGVAAGGVLNMALDPVFIFVFKMGVSGAAIATMLSNLATAAFFACFILARRRHMSATLDIRAYTLGDRIPFEVLTVGLPSFMASTLATVSNMMLNHLIGSYSDEATAGIGIAKKIDMLAFAIAQGMTQGSLPLIGYNYTSGNRRRMNDAIKTTMTMCFCVAIAGAVWLLTCAAPMAGLFIDSEKTVEYGTGFLRIIALTCITTAPGFMIITIFQATGQRIKPLLLSFLRKGIIDIPLMLVLEHFFGIYGIVWAIPLADATALLISLCVFLPYYKGLRRSEAETGGPTRP